MPPDRVPIFIRFVAARVDEDSHRREGVFQGAFDLLESPTSPLTDEERATLAEIIA